MSKELEHLKSEIKRLEELLAQDSRYVAEQTFQNIFDNSSDLIYIHDEQGVFLDVNKAVIDKYGYQKHEVIGNTAQIFSAPDGNDMQEVGEKVGIVWQGGPPQTLEWWSMKKDKTIFLKELILRKGVYFGKDVIIATGRDITERKEVEQKLLDKNEELKKLNEALDAFVYSASHDLKAPLSSIKGLIDLLKKDTETDPKLFLDRIDLSVDKLVKFVNDLVEYSRNARTTIKSEQIDFKKLINSVTDDLEYMPENKHVEKIIKVNTSQQFYSDEYRLNVILNNLVSNAIRYSDPEKTKSYVKITVESADAEGALCMSVEDNGIGIESTHANNIFDMFYRANELKAGSGLGLYIVNETINKLKGSVSYSSEIGKGSRFEVQLRSCKS